MTLAGYQVSDPAPRAFNVNPPPRNQVDVAVEYGLPRDLSGIHANVEARDLYVGTYDLCPLFLDQAVASIEFRPTQVKVGRHMAFVNHQ